MSDESEIERFKRVFRSYSTIGEHPTFPVAESEGSGESKETVESKRSSESKTEAAADGATTAAYGDQNLWSKMSTKARAGAKTMLVNGEDVRAVLDYLRGNRAGIAIMQKPGSKEEFGTKRPTISEEFSPDVIEYNEALFGIHAKIALGERTPMKGVYEEAGRQARHVLDTMDDAPDDFRPLVIPAMAAQFSDLMTDSPETELTGYRSLGQIGDETVELTGAVFSQDGQPMGGAWLHTDPEVTEKALKHVAGLHATLLAGQKEQALAGGRDETAYEKLQLAGSIAWWLYHAMPYKRGSAGIIGWYLSTMMEHMGRDPDRVVGGMDLVAFRMSERDFARWFANQIVDLD